MPVAITNPSHYSNSSSSAVSVAASVLFQPKNLHQSHNQDASETVAILSNHLFHQLKSAASSSSSESLSLTIAINLKRPNKDGIKNLVLKARNQLEGEIGQVAADAVQESSTILLPYFLRRHFSPSTSTSPSTKVSLYSPILLTFLYLSISSQSSFDQIQEDPSNLETLLNNRIMRVGEKVNLGNGAEGKVVGVEPVLQGLVDLGLEDSNEEDEKEQRTELIVVLNETQETTESETDSEVSFSINGGGDADEDAEGSEEGDEVEIEFDESFLAQSVLQGFEGLQIGNNGRQVNGNPNGDQSQPNLSSNPTSKVSSYSSIKFDLELLRSRALVYNSISNYRDQKNGEGGSSQEEEEEIDSESLILMNERDLLKLGAFNGDWVVVKLEENQINERKGNSNSKGKGKEKERLIRVFCLQDSDSKSPTKRHSSSQPKTLIPPLLYQNLMHSSSFDPLSSISSHHLRIQLLPNSSLSTSTTPLSIPLSLPFADSLSISRVPSQISTSKNFQPLFLAGLRSYFEGKRRVVKKGDLIAVGIGERGGRFVKNLGSGGDEEEEGEKDEKKDGEQVEEEEGMDWDLPVGNSNKKVRFDETDQLQDEKLSQVVFFYISSLVPELLPPSKEDPSISSISNLLSLKEKARKGKLGSIVDSRISKLVQTGVENKRVVFMGDYLGIERDGLPTFPRDEDEEKPNVLSSSSSLTGTSSIYQKLQDLLKATMRKDSGNLGIHLSVLLKGARGSGKKTLVKWLAEKSGVHLIEVDCFSLLSDTDVRTEGILRSRFDKAIACSPSILLLKNIDALARKSQAMETGLEPSMTGILEDCIDGLRKAGKKNKNKNKDKKIQSRVNGLPEDGEEEEEDREIEEDEEDENPKPVAIVATTSDHEKCPSGVLACFKHEFSIEAPNESQRLEILKNTLEDSPLGLDVSLKNLATQTAALVAADLVDLVSRARLASMERLRKAFSHLSTPPTDTDLLTAGLCLTGSDFESALSAARSSYSASIGAPKIPSVTWDDVGGLASVKSDILDTIQLPLEHPELFSSGLKKRSGILLYGPPGTGKTLLAKAVATSCSLNFFSVKGPELLNMYIGESEANVRRVFARARDAKPCVIFFDELDSVAPKRGNQGDSGGVMDRIVSQLLAELDGMAGGGEGNDVFVIGATNRPDLLDPALLRPGRFDRLLYLSVAETHANQLPIIEALTRKFKLAEDCSDLSVIANQCPLNLTGADFYALCSDALLKAMTRKAEEVDAIIAQINDENETEIQKEREMDSMSGVTKRKVRSHPHPLTPQYYLAELSKKEDTEIKVSKVDFENALRELVPSVSEAEMQHYRSVREKFETVKKEGKDEERKEEMQASENRKVMEGLGSQNPDLERQRKMFYDLMKKDPEEAARLLGYQSVGGLIDSSSSSSSSVPAQTSKSTLSSVPNPSNLKDEVEAEPCDLASQVTSSTIEASASEAQSTVAKSATGSVISPPIEAPNKNQKVEGESNGQEASGGKGKGKNKGKGKGKA